jgi:GTPase involved in cell partitioning and DNA repair
MYKEYLQKLETLKGKVNKIELGINDELGKYTKELDASADTLKKKTLDAEKELTSVKKAAANVKKRESVLIKEASDINKTMTALNQVLTEADSAAKNLGIKPSDLPNYNRAEDMLMVANKAMSEAYKVADNIDAIKITV